VSKIKGSEVLVIGDSFLALSHDITKRLEQNAKNAGIMDLSDNFRDSSVSGTMLNGGISPTIPTQYKNGVNAGTVKYVIMDGGGNDCMMGSVDGAANSFKSLLKQMESDGIVKIFYLFYPDAMGSMAGTLNPNLNKLRPIIQDAVTKSTAPKGYFLDLRPTFEGKYSQYILSDGIHPTTAGSNAAADAIWTEMQKNSFFADDTPTTPTSAFTKIEAESYGTQSGIQTETCTEGGQSIGYIENGDYAVYNNIDFGTGAAGFQARVSSAASGGNIEIRLDSNTGTLVGTCPVAATGDWQTWTDAKCAVSGVSGKHDLYLKFTGGSGYLFNFNWFTFSAQGTLEKLGDLNSDEQIDAIDFQLMKKYLLGLGTIENPESADVDANGEVNALDFSLLKQYLLGTITTFPGQGAV
jgi:hypothetical protein